MQGLIECSKFSDEAPFHLNIWLFLPPPAPQACRDTCSLGCSSLHEAVIGFAVGRFKWFTQSRTIKIHYLQSSYSSTLFPGYKGENTLWRFRTNIRRLCHPISVTNNRSHAFQDWQECKIFTLEVERWGPAVAGIYTSAPRFEITATSSHTVCDL